MEMKSSENLLKVLNSYNTWWRTGQMPKFMNREFKRFGFYEALEIMSNSQIKRDVIISGARRVGKTTIMNQLIDYLLGQHVESRRILYISFDHPVFKIFSMDEVLSVYHDDIYPEKDSYYFFDEVQYCEDWDKWLKTLYDTQPNSKIIATGSASPALIEKVGESGVGRWRILKIPTLSFYEYCNLLKVEDRPVLDKSIKPTQVFKQSAPKVTDLFTKLEPMQKHFNRYLRVGGFPELALSRDDAYASRVLREEIVDKVLKRDIPALYKIQNPIVLEKIFLYLCYHSSSIINISAMNKELEGVSRTTLERYIEFLESANLIYISSPINISGKKALKSRDKIYIADAAIKTAVLMQGDEILSDPTEMGALVETTIFKHIFSFYYQQSTRVGYYREHGESQKEIDIVVEAGRSTILIEVKYRNETELGKYEAILNLANSESAAIVVTKKDLDYGVNILENGAQINRIPAYAFLYLLGHAEEKGYKRLDSK